jgi:hypothetical protein
MNRTSKHAFLSTLVATTVALAFAPQLPAQADNRPLFDMEQSLRLLQKNRVTESRYLIGPRGYRFGFVQINYPANGNVPAESVVEIWLSDWVNLRSPVSPTATWSLLLLAVTVITLLVLRGLKKSSQITLQRQQIKAAA